MSQAPNDGTRVSDAYADAQSAIGLLVQRGGSWSGYERNVCYLNTGGPRFANVSGVSGLDYDEDSRGVAVVDWNFDGKLDLWITNRTGPQLRFLQNDSQEGYHFVAFRLEGRSCNRDAIGARLELYRSGQRPKQIQTLRAGEGFVSQGSKWVHFGLGDSTEIERLVVRWPGGEAEEFRGIEADRFYQVVQHSGEAVRWDPPRREPLPVAEHVIPPKTEQSRVVLANRVPLPLLRYQDFDGQPQVVNQEHGGPMLVNLWATWCRPCATELNELVEHEAELRAHGLDVVALSVDAVAEDLRSAPDAASQFLERIGYPWRAGEANAEIMHKLEQMEVAMFILQLPFPVPTSFLLDEKGNLAVIYRGPVEMDVLLADLQMLKSVQTPSQTLVAGMPRPGRWRFRPYEKLILDVGDQLRARGYPEEGRRYLRAQMDWYLAEADLPNVEQRIEELKHKMVEATAEEARASFERGDYEQALQTVREAVEANPTDPELRNNLGVLLASGNNVEGAVAQFREALRLKPDYTHVYGNLAYALMTLGRAQEALTVYREALEIRPDWPTVQNNLAWMLATHPDASIRDGAEAVRLAEALCESTNYSQPVPLDTLAASYAEAGNMDRAVYMAELAVSLAMSEGQHDLALEIRNRLEFYRNGQSYQAGSTAAEAAQSR